MQLLESQIILPRTTWGVSASEFWRAGISRNVSMVRKTKIAEKKIEDAQKALMKAMDHKDLQVRRAAALALGSFPDSSVVKLLSGKDGIKNNADPLMAGFAAVSLGSVLLIAGGMAALRREGRPWPGLAVGLGLGVAAFFYTWAGALLLIGLLHLMLPVIASRMPGLETVPADWRSSIMGAATYLLLGLAFVWVGAGSMRKRRWARPRQPSSAGPGR